MGFWFNPLHKDSKVDSTVYGNKFLGKYWETSATNSQPLGTKIDPKTALKPSVYDSLYTSSSSSSSSGVSGQNSIFSSYMNIGTINQQNSYPTSNNSGTQTSGSASGNTIFDAYWNYNYSNVGTGNINPPIQSGNQTISSYQDLINGNTNQQNSTNNSTNNNTSSGQTSKGANQYNYLDGYWNGSNYEVSNNPLSTPLYVGNGKTVTSYADLFN